MDPYPHSPTRVYGVVIRDNFTIYYNVTVLVTKYVTDDLTELPELKPFLHKLMILQIIKNLDFNGSQRTITVIITAYQCNVSSVT
jgi:hypothetical protein